MLFLSVNNKASYTLLGCWIQQTAIGLWQNYFSGLDIEDHWIIVEDIHDEVFILKKLSIGKQIVLFRVETETSSDLSF